ncbi:penicillin acylase family protein [Melioribacteraceae bacterium 4301-Me]|uniref:penicillin acylase family protein n=1 Tax=Pyranulibacter aquaticus TaxID=3163344 RepID=UPI0035949B28
MKTWKKITIGVLASLLIILIAIVAFSYLMIQKTFPKYDGEVKVAGLYDSVVIYRDSYAIPYVKAKTEEDAIFALGYLHAQERLFQMDIARRAGEGRLSEILGSKVLPIDKMFKTIGIYKNVKKDYEKLNDISKKYLIAYSKGVNAFIKNAKGKYQLEFDILDYDPYQWTPLHSLVIAKLMAWELNISWWTDIAFANLVKKLGEEKAKELIPSFPENAPTIIPQETKYFSNIDDGIIKVDRQFRELIGMVGTHIGSNNWVVNSQISLSGKPIIANDPHLAYTAPGRWYFAILKSDKLNVEGFTIPGLPAIVIGTNQNIAWALTNVMTDDADFYAEKLDSTNSRYFFNGNWLPLTVRDDTIHVKDSSDVIIKVRSTHRGPIISDIHPFNKLYSNAKVVQALSMKWTALDFSDEIYAMISVNKATNWNEFKNALKYFTVPGQNFVYADNKGNIGYICAARLPIRKTNTTTLVFDGTTDKYDWEGFVPYEQMPKLFNPSQNFIASANNKTVKNFPYHISNIWEPSSRIERIVSLLNSKKLHSVNDFEKYQMDFVSPYAKKISQYIIDAFQNEKITDENVKTAVELLKNWDYNFNSRSQTPTIYTKFLEFLIKNLFEKKMGKDLMEEYVFIANIPYRILEELLENPNSYWFDDLDTPKIENREDIIRKSLYSAVDDLQKEYGNELAQWQWGKVHKVTFKHLFHSASPLLDNLVDIGTYSIGGDGTTIFNTEYSFADLYNKVPKPTRSKPYENILGPSMRYIYDFSQPDYIYLILTTGQSGNFFSDNYKDMTKKWLNGEYIKLPINEKKFTYRSKHKLILLP